MSANFEISPSVPGSEVGEGPAAGEYDLVERTRYYAAAEGADVAERFFTAAVDAVRFVEIMPGIDSPLVRERIGVPELRRVGVEGFPCGWFYFQRSDHLDVVRPLADKQDLDDLFGGEV